MFSLLLVISVYDMRHKIIPDTLVFAFGFIAFFSMFLNQGLGDNIFIQPTFLSLISGVVYALPFAIISLVSRQRLMGFGDSKMILGIGWMLGMMQGGAAIMLAFWIGTLVSLIIMFFGKYKISMNTEVPFGPFLAISAFLVFVFNINIFDLASVFTF
jgi:leader peptidase (prepilin peptidase)/N-methyltransferase